MDEKSGVMLTKFDAAERQLLQAIRMFFSDQDSVSIHTLTEAAGQVLHDIGKGSVTSMFRDSELVRPEYKKEWLAAIFKSRNFFKHADKDPDAQHEFKDMFNHMSLLDAIHMYGAIKGVWTPETIAYFIWFGRAYPKLLRDDDDPQFKRAFQNLSTMPESDPGNKAHYGRLIAALRDGTAPLPPNVTLAWGRTPS